MVKAYPQAFLPLVEAQGISLTVYSAYGRSVFPPPYTVMRELFDPPGPLVRSISFLDLEGRFSTRQAWDRFTQTLKDSEIQTLVFLPEEESAQLPQVTAYQQSHLCAFAHLFLQAGFSCFIAPASPVVRASETPLAENR